MRARSAAARHQGGFVVLRALLRQRRRLLLAGVSIALGVGYLAGALGLLGRIGAGLDQLASVSADDAEVVIEGSVAYESSLEQVRRLVPAALAASAEGLDGVASASHRLEDVALVSDETGNPVATPGLSGQPRGVNWPEDPAVSNLEFLDGEPPGADDEVAIDEHTAEVAGAGLGDTVRVAGKGKVGSYTVSGVVASTEAGSNDASSLVVLTTDEARLVFDQAADDNRIALRLEPGAEVQQVMDELRGVVPAGVEVTDGATAARHAQESLTRSFTVVRVLVTAFGILALLVGTVTVANSLALLHSQRRRLFAGFRLAGASRGQLRTASLAEAVVLALVASLSGIPLGVVLALVIERALGALGSAVPTAGPPLGIAAAAVAVGMGVLATVAAAWRPVATACSVPPIEAVQEVPPDPQRRRRPLLKALSAAVVGSAMVAALGLIASLGVATSLLASVAAGAVVFLVALTPALLTRSVSAALRRAPFRPAPLRRVAARDARRNPRRTAATTAAVLLAAAVVTALTVFLQSFTESVDDAVGGLVSADLVVDSETFTRGGLPSDLVEQLGFVEGVSQVSGWKLGRGSVADQSVRMTGLDGSAALDVVDPGFEGAPPDGLAVDEAWVSASFAQRAGVGVGDAIPVLFHSGGFEDLRVTAVYGSGSGLLGDVVMDGTVLSSQVPATTDLVALVDTDGSAATEAAVRELAESYGVPAVLSPADFVSSRAEMLRGFERVILWMLLFTLLQALVGVVNTLVLSVGERRREFGLLRVNGASRRALMRMVLFEGVAFSTVGTLLGAAIGVGAAAAGVWALGTFGLGVFSVPLGALAVVAASAVLVGVAAAWVPARMASAVPPLDALADVGAEPVLTRARRRRRGGAGTPAVAPAPVPGPAAGAAPASPLPPRSAPAPVASEVPTGPLTPPPFDPARLPSPLAAPLQATAGPTSPVASPAPAAAQTPCARRRGTVGSARSSRHVPSGRPNPGSHPSLLCRRASCAPEQAVPSQQAVPPQQAVPQEPAAAQGLQRGPAGHRGAQAARPCRRLETPPRRARRAAQPNPAEGFVGAAAVPGPSPQPTARQWGRRQPGVRQHADGPGHPRALGGGAQLDAGGAGVR
ncbi:MAG: FtsX-like permease family protein [Microthrixaceae bacterium]